VGAPNSGTVLKPNGKTRNITTTRRRERLHIMQLARHRSQPLQECFRGMRVAALDIS
jgi:hypothetical protein